WKMLRQAIENIPDSQWHYGANEWFYSLTVYHIVETAEFYVNSSPEAMVWGKRGGFVWDDVKDIKSDVLPRITKESQIEYASDIGSCIDSLLKSITPDELSQPDGFHWFSSVFEKLLYLLRHCAHHVGELNRALRESDNERISWV
ncbi:MAG: hypothetical protein ACW992_08905, partial [Candidatus Thorarchaeota archaeon]